MTDNTRKTSISRTNEIQRGLRDIMPLSFGVIVYGLAFGILAAQLGMDALATGLMGAFVFAGSAQIVAVERLVTGAGVFTAVIAGLALNLRIFLMTASLNKELAGRPFWQVFLGVHLTSDENWVLMHATRAKGQHAGYWYLVSAGLSIISVWVVSSALGAVFAYSLPDLSSSGMDFAFTAAFILMLTNLWNGRQSLPPWIISSIIAGSCALLLPIDPSWGLIVGALAGTLIAVRPIK